MSVREKNITILKVSPCCEPVIVTLKNDLRSLQEAVSIDAPYVGLIEILSLDETHCILMNEEGKLLNLPPNRRLGYDILCGVFYVVGQDTEGNLTSLSAASLEKYRQFFSRIEPIDSSEVEKTISAMFCDW